RRGFAVLCCLFTGISLSAQTAKDPPAGSSISRQLYSFSPLGAVYVRRPGMEDKNSNGVIDRGAAAAPAKVMSNSPKNTAMRTPVLPPTA
ncbi:MAG: hypothetical protein LBE17_11315, partial [Treponema sp.]|nr:hypothetical protein [Treponema sp.]